MMRILHILRFSHQCVRLNQELSMISEIKILTSNSLKPATLPILNGSEERALIVL